MSQFIDRHSSKLLLERRFPDANIVKVFSDAGHHQEAEEYLRTGIDSCVSRLGEDHLLVGFAYADLATLLFKHEEYEKAEREFNEARRRLLDRPDVPVARKRELITQLIALYERTDRPDSVKIWRKRLSEMKSQ